MKLPLQREFVTGLEGLKSIMRGQNDEVLGLLAEPFRICYLRA